MATVRRYLLLQQDTLTKIWGDSGIGKNSLRKWIFDYDAFATGSHSLLTSFALAVSIGLKCVVRFTGFKGEVAKWGAATFQANVSGF